MKTKYQSYFDFKYKYFNRPEKAKSYRLGQAFLNEHVVNSSMYVILWNCVDDRISEKLIYDLIDMYNWDLMKLEIVREGVTESHPEHFK